MSSTIANDKVVVINNEQFPVSKRVNALREKVLSTKPGICIERARIYTEVYRDNEEKPVILKRALALRETLRRMTIWIGENELIVGNHSSKLRAAPIFPEYATSWILKEMDDFEKRPGDAFFPTEDQKAELRELLPWWKGRTTLERGYAIMDPRLREIHDSGMIRAEGNLTSGDGHIAVNFYRVMELGINGYRDETRRRRETLDMALARDVDRKMFYDAVDISLEGFQTFIERFAVLAEEMAKKEQDETRRGELQEISRICSRLPLHAPETFREAIQLVWFMQLVLQIESNGHSVSLARLDQYLYPLFEKDKKAGLLTDAQAVELLECLWVKMVAVKKVRSWSHTRFSAGGPLYQNVTIGGQTPTGGDAVNRLSYLILHAVGNLKLTQPNLTVRYHRNMSEDFMQACIRVIEKGFGMPAFNNDEIVIPELIKLGVEKEEACDYSAIGCIEVAVPGKWGYRCTGMSFLNFMRVLLAAMHDGKDVVSGKIFHQGKGHFRDFGDFERLMEAWREQAVFYSHAMVAIDTAIDLTLEREVPDILCSAFTDDCLARGLTVKQGGSKYDYISGLQVGIANMGNALAAIKKLVFDEKRIGKEELLAALESDFAGPEGEKLRQIILNHAPKFGNDDDSVDLLTRRAYEMFIDDYETHITTRHGRGPIGCRYFAGTSSISANVPQGAVVPATPDGRKAGKPLAEGCSPTSGTDVNGPTAVFKSVTKLPTARIFGGVLLNQKLSPAAIRCDGDKAKLATMMRVFFDDLLGWHVQYNIVDKKTLLAAKANPREYRDLVVRVAGYSAFFADLAPDTQDDIIARTEHEL